MRIFLLTEGENYGIIAVGNSILGCRQAVRHQTLTLASVGSNPAIPASRKGTLLGAFSAGWDWHLYEPSRERGVGAHSSLGDRQARLSGAERANHGAKRSYPSGYLDSRGRLSLQKILYIS